ncbi:MAG: chemotaxis protein CheW [Candidatus Eisenbacteria bacterium]|nr:chemotaxis protein CheW [Candidatus Eisenbacteria bacterium]
MMRWANRQAALVELELLMFTVGGVRVATPLERVAGVLTDVSLLAEHSDLASIPYNGENVPLVRAENIFEVGARTHASPGALILFRTLSGLYAVAVDEALDVLRVTPGDRLYRFPPEDAGWASRRRPWGFVELGDVPILLVDFGPLRVH